MKLGERLLIRRSLFEAGVLHDGPAADDLLGLRERPVGGPWLTVRAGDYGTFTRASSGLVRELSTSDMAWFGIFAAGSPTSAPVPCPAGSVRRDDVVVIVPDHRGLRLRRFGGGEVAHADVPLPVGVKWAASERMAQEKEAFGFYFSAHPTDRYRHLAQAHGCRRPRRCQP